MNEGGAHFVKVRFELSFEVCVVTNQMHCPMSGTGISIQGICAFNVTKSLFNPYMMRNYKTVMVD